MLKDKNGFLWLGTEDGLNRYDGYQFVTYRHNADDPRSISSNVISALLEDKKGNIWVGTNGGSINKFEEGSNSFINYRLNSAGKD